jgi:hypothetical protein
MKKFLAIFTALALVVGLGITGMLAYAAAPDNVAALECESPPICIADDDTFCANCKLQDAVQELLDLIAKAKAGEWDDLKDLEQLEAKLTLDVAIEVAEAFLAELAKVKFGPAAFPVAEDEVDGVQAEIDELEKAMDDAKGEDADNPWVTFPMEPGEAVEEALGAFDDAVLALIAALDEALDEYDAEGFAEIAALAVLKAALEELKAFDAEELEELMDALELALEVLADLLDDDDAGPAAIALAKFMVTKAEAEINDFLDSINDLLEAIADNIEKLDLNEELLDAVLEALEEAQEALEALEAAVEKEIDPEPETTTEAPTTTTAAEDTTTTTAAPTTTVAPTTEGPGFLARVWDFISGAFNWTYNILRNYVFYYVFFGWYWLGGK